MMIPIMFIVCMLIILTLSYALILSWVKPKHIYNLSIAMDGNREVRLLLYHFVHESDCKKHFDELTEGDYSYFKDVSNGVSLTELCSSEYTITDIQMSKKQLH